MKKIYSLFFAVLVLTGTLLSQDAPNSVGPSPFSSVGQPQISSQFDAAVGSRAFTQISSTPTFQFGKCFMESCTITNIGSAFTITFPGGLVYRNGVVYTWNQSSPFQLWSIDTVTGVHTLVFNMTGVPQANYTGMCWDGTTMYGVSTSVTQSQIFTVNMTSGVCTPLGTASATCAGAISLLGRPGAQYSLFSLDIVADNLYKWNKTTGTVALVGPLGQNINFGQDGGVDPNDNTFYNMVYTTGPELRKVDTATGTLGPALCTYTAQATGLAIVPSAPPPPPSVFPNWFYFKFENNPGPTQVLNCAIPGVGSGFTLGAGTPLNSGGQFDSCISGSNLTTGGITTGFNWSPGTSSWTISMWISIPSTSSGSAYYLFGDGGNSFRCFHNGVALQDNLVLRGTGVTDVNVTGIGPAPTVVTFVYDSAAAQIRAYKNGTLANTVAQTLNLTGGTGFKVGGYGASTSFGGKMDEFRVWNRALTPAEVSATWNSDLGGCGIVGINQNGNEIPDAYKLSQNYPNPFNPTTNIKFSLPATGNVKLVVFDMLGREVATLVNEVKTAGNYVVDFDASALASGVYFYRLEAANFTQTKKMLLVK